MAKKWMHNTSLQPSFISSDIEPLDHLVLYPGAIYCDNASVDEKHFACDIEI